MQDDELASMQMAEGLSCGKKGRIGQNQEALVRNASSPQCDGAARPTQAVEFFFEAVCRSPDD